MEQTASPGMDREVFERVWRRVMPEDRGDCPFTVPVSEPEADQTGGVPAVPVQLMDLGQVEEGADLTCLGAAAAPSRRRRV